MARACTDDAGGQMAASKLSIAEGIRVTEPIVPPLETSHARPGKG